MTRFTGAVVKSRPLKTVGAEQILLDVQAVKSCLLELPDPSAEIGNDRCVADGCFSGWQPDESFLQLLSTRTQGNWSNRDDAESRSCSGGD